MDTAPATIVFTAFCLAALGFALWRPDAGRLVLGLFFIIMAGGVPVVFVMASPDGFVDLDTTAPLPSPWWVFEHVVAKAPATFGLLVASYGVVIGLMMVKGGRWASLGLAGGIVLLLVIAPLCPWTVQGLIMAAALGAILLRDPRPSSSLRGVEAGSPDARCVPLGKTARRKECRHHETVSSGCSSRWRIRGCHTGALRGGIKAERAESIGARLELSSSEDGTCVRAVWRP